MPRSPAFRFLRTAAAGTARPDGGRHDVRRRDVLAGAGSLAAAALLGLRPAAGQAASARIAVVGAGLAGLTAAHRLRQAGFAPAVLEGNTRLGGRCLSARGLFGSGQVVERGGEFIDSGHGAIRALAAELGLSLTDVLAAQPAGAVPIYRFAGERYTLADATRDFAPLHPVLQEQRAAIGPAVNHAASTEAARRFDAMSARDWIAAYVPGGPGSRLGRLIDDAYSEEDAADTDRQSALNIVGSLAGNAPDDFRLYYGDSDQRFRVAGGNDQVPARLGDRLAGAVRTGTRLAALRVRAGGGAVLTLARDGAVRDEPFDRVVLALPFSVLRAAVDWSGAGFGPLKARAIRELGMGASAKLQVQLDRRRWSELGCDGEVRCDDPAFQATWDASRGQAGAEGVLCFWSGGSRARFAGAAPDRDALARRCLDAAEPILPGLSRLWNGRATLDAWQSNPWSLGSYASLPPGYWTSLLGVEASREGDVFFAGEHTWPSTGYMNSAVASGERAAREVAASLAD